MNGSSGLGCVLLAAGSSSRMGRPKLTLPFRGGTILGATAGAALEAGLRVVVVCKPDDEALLDEIARIGRGLEAAVNPDPSRGMLASLQVGLAHLMAGQAREGLFVPLPGFFFLPADMPFISPDTFAAMAGVAMAGVGLVGAAADRIVVPTCGGRRGHLVLVPRALMDGIMGLGQGAALRDFIAASGPLFFETGDAGVLRDVDTMADYAAALEGIEAVFRLPARLLYSPRVAA